MNASFRARVFLRGLFLCLVASFLTACAGLRQIDSEVTSFTRWQGSAAGSGTAYRFERLPSQDLAAAGPSEISQDQLEAVATQALARLGLVHRPDAPLLTVQLGRTSVLQPGGYGSPWGSPWGGPGISLGTGTAGSFVGMSFPLMRYDPPLYLRELSVVMRDSRSNAVLFESRARHSGSSANGAVVWPAMLEAALSGFPQPPAGPRRVNVELPR